MCSVTPFPPLVEHVFLYIKTDGVGGGNRSSAQYPDAMLVRMVAVGTTPSSGGARAPVADILPHLGADVRRRF